MERTHSIAELASVAVGLDHPEGIAPGLDGCLYAGGEAGQVYRIEPTSGGVEEIATTGGFLLGVCLDGDGAIYVCDADRLAVFRVDPVSGRVETWCESVGGQPLRLPNCAAFAHDGSLWFTDSGSPEVPNGLLVRVPPGGGDGELQNLGDLHFPNGLAIAPNGTLYLLESYRPRVSALRNGVLTPICELPGVVPDGIAIDTAGGLVIACYYPFQLLRVTPGESSARLLLDDPYALRLAMPTNVCFYGDDRRKLAIAALGGHEIVSLELPHPGAPLHYPSARRAGSAA